MRLWGLMIIFSSGKSVILANRRKRPRFVERSPQMFVENGESMTSTQHCLSDHFLSKIWQYEKRRTAASWYEIITMSMYTCGSALLDCSKVENRVRVTHVDDHSESGITTHISLREVLEETVNIRLWINSSHSTSTLFCVRDLVRYL